jgi:hypothetical protein
LAFCFHGYIPVKVPLAGSAFLARKINIRRPALVERPYRPGRVDYKSERDAEEVGQPAVRLPQTLLPPMFIYCPINLAIVISVIMRTSAHHSIFLLFLFPAVKHFYK